MMNLELAGKRVLVTGGTKGVGLAVVLDALGCNEAARDCCARCER